jgi:hypothetical protein
LQQRHARHGAVGSVVLQTLAQCVTGRTLGGFCTEPGISLGINLGIKARLGINARNPAQVIGKVGIGPKVDPAQVEAMMREKNMREVMILNLKGVGLTSLNPQTASQLVGLLYTIRSDDETFLDRVEIHNSSPLFEMLYKQVKRNLPPKLVSLIEFRN